MNLERIWILIQIIWNGNSSILILITADSPSYSFLYPFHFSLSLFPSFCFFSLCFLISIQALWRDAERRRSDQESLLQTCTMQHITTVMEMAAKYDTLEWVCYLILWIPNQWENRKFYDVCWILNLFVIICSYCYDHVSSLLISIDLFENNSLTERSFHPPGHRQ